MTVSIKPGLLSAAQRGNEQMATELNELATVYRLWNLEQTYIEYAADKLEDIFKILTLRETSIHETPYKPCDVVQILRRNDITKQYDVLFTVVRGNVY